MIRGVRIATLLLLAMAATVEGQVRVGSVSGSIQAEDGAPAAGIRVAAVAAGDVDGFQAGTLVSATLTDEAGRYRLEDIPPGRYFIAAGPIGAPIYFPGTTVESKATAISIAAGARTENLNFKLMEPAGVRVSGVVTGLPLNPSAQTLRVYSVALTGAALRSRGSQVIRSSLKEDGTFELRSVPPGTYLIYLLPGTQRQNLTVGESNIDNVAFDAPPVVTGRVAFDDGSPVPTSALIVIVPSDGNGFTSYPVSSDGTFSFAPTPGVTYTVLAYSLPFGSYLKSLQSGSVDLRTTRLAVDAGVAVKEIDVVLTKQRPMTEPEGVNVRGRVTTNAPALPAGLDIELTMSPTRYSQRIQVASDGSFAYSNVPPGKYTARLSVGGTSPFGFAPVEVTVNNPGIDNLELTVPAQFTIKGRIQIENGNASSTPPMMAIRLIRSDGRNIYVQAGSSPFGALVLEGTYKAAVMTAPMRYIVKSLTYGSADATLGMTIDPSKPLEEMVITLRDQQAP